MNKTTIVKTILEPFIGQNGYKYIPKGKGIWKYEKKENGITYSFWIQEDRFAQELKLVFETNAFQYPRREAWDIISDKDKEKYQRNKNVSETGEWKYEDEEEFTESIRDFLEILLKYERLVMDELKMEEEIIPTIEMAEILYKEHGRLASKLKRNNQEEEFCTQEIAKWFSGIRKMIEDTQDKPYENVQEMLIEIAAFLGDEIIKYAGGSWKHAENSRITYISGLNCYILSSIQILNETVEMWKKNNCTRLEEFCKYFYESKLPVSAEKMSVLSDWQNNLWEN